MHPLLGDFGCLENPGLDSFIRATQRTTASLRGGVATIYNSAKHVTINSIVAAHKFKHLVNRLRKMSFSFGLPLPRRTVYYQQDFGDQFPQFPISREQSIFTPLNHFTDLPGPTNRLGTVMTKFAKNYRKTMCDAGLNEFCEKRLPIWFVLLLLIALLFVCFVLFWLHVEVDEQMEQLGDDSLDYTYSFFEVLREKIALSKHYFVKMIWPLETRITLAERRNHLRGVDGHIVDAHEMDPEYLVVQSLIASAKRMRPNCQFYSDKPHLRRAVYDAVIRTISYDLDKQIFDNNKKEEEEQNGILRNANIYATERGRLEQAALMGALTPTSAELRTLQMVQSAEVIDRAKRALILNRDSNE